MKTFRKIGFSSIVMVGTATLATVLFAAGPNASAVDAEFKAMDTTKDGKVSAEEHAAASRKMFEMMDANKDGKVTAAEMTSARITGKKAKKSDLSAADKIKVIDTDADGILTREEHAAGSHSMFEKVDTDKNGFLTKSELAAGYASMMKKPAR